MIWRLRVLTVFGLGRSRTAPGTWGSIPPVVLALALVWALWPQWWMVNLCVALFGAVFAVACARFGAEAELAFGHKDPAPVVADEVAGQSIALLLLPWRPPVDGASWTWNLILAAVAFGTFRLFDITKPPPADRAQQLGGGWGILVDDLIAGAYALIATQLIARLALPLL